MKTVRTISYKKLWKLLVDKNMNKQDLERICDISSTSVSKLVKGKNISTNILLKICNGLDCDIEDILETVHTRL